MHKMSHLQQIEMGYNALQDRILLTIHTDNFLSFKFWITQRIARQLNEAISYLLSDKEETPKEMKQVEKVVQKQIEQENKSKSPLAQKLSTNLSKSPLGKEPLLISEIQIKNEILIFIDTLKTTFEIVPNSVILLALSKLLKEMSEKAQWDLITLG